MKVNEVAFVAYTVTDLTKARKFYEDLFELKATNVWIDPKTNMGFIEYDIGTTTLCLGSGAPNFESGPAGGVVALEVADFETALADIRSAKVKIVSEPNTTPVCRVMTIEDIDGNRILIHQRKK